MGKLFGTDGVRGVANTALTPELAFKMGKAAAYVLSKDKDKAVNILIGMDTRVSGDMFEAALVAGMCSVGAIVWPIGIIPTPGIAYLVRHYKMDAGVVISASHNPAEYNGIKIFGKEGYKLPDALEEEIESIINNDTYDLPRPTTGIGYKKTRQDALINYSDFLTGITPDLDLKGFRIVLDCANGATASAAPMVFKSFGADVHTIHNYPDGYNINKGCGSTHMESLVNYVLDNDIDIGIAFDGDGDRCLLVDEKGKIVEGDEMLSIYAKYLNDRGMLKNKTMVATVMSNLGLSLMGEEQGINVLKATVGDRYVLEKMIETGANLGGEQSGHIIFLDYNTTGDGILSAIQMLKIMKDTGKSLSELNSVMKVFPQVLINARVDDGKKYDFDKIDEIRDMIEEVEAKFAGRGRVLIRASGTEPLVRVMIEGEDQGLIRQEALKAAEIIERLLS